MSAAPGVAPPDTGSTQTGSSRAALVALAVIAVSPATWFLHLNLSYLLVPPSCRAGHRWYLLGATVAALAVIGSSAVRSLRARRGNGGEGLEAFLGRMGIWFSALFAGATLLVGLSAAIVGPCR